MESVVSMSLMPVLKGFAKMELHAWIRVLDTNASVQMDTLEEIATRAFLTVKPIRAHQLPLALTSAMDSIASVHLT